jgi:uncharacterized protein
MPHAAAARESGVKRAPRDCGDFEIHIDREGQWFYRGSPIGRAALVRLFSTVLRREGNEYFLVTPAERGRITVADAPFLAVELARAGEGKTAALSFRTNVDDWVTLDAAHPLRVETLDTGEPRPYLLVRDGLEARLLRPVFYELVEVGMEERIGGVIRFGVWSKSAFFPLS